MAGTLDLKDQPQLEKMIFRASRGKVLTYFDPDSFTLEDAEGNQIERKVYVLVFQAGDFLKERVHRICESFMAKTFQLPEDGHGGPQSFKNIIKEIKDKLR